MSALIGGNVISSKLIMRIYSNAVDTLNIRDRGCHFDLLNIAGRDTGPGGIERAPPQKSNELEKSEIPPKLERSCALFLNRSIGFELTKSRTESCDTFLI